MAAAASGPSWSVSNQQETVDLDAQGKAGPGVRVFFTTGHGIHASIFVPHAQYTVENVKALISARVAILDGVQSLSSG